MEPIFDFYKQTNMKRAYAVIYTNTIMHMAGLFLYIICKVTYKDEINGTQYAVKA